MVYSENTARNASLMLPESRVLQSQMATISHYISQYKDIIFYQYETVFAPCYSSYSVYGGQQRANVVHERKMMVKVNNYSAPFVKSIEIIQNFQLSSDILTLI